MKVPTEILEKHYNVIIGADSFFVNSLYLFSSVSRLIKGYIIDMVYNRSISIIIGYIENIVGLNNNRGFKIQTISIDSEFEYVKQEIKKIFI